VANLLQTLSNDGESVLTSSKVTSALESAPVSDIVQLSVQASQLANVDTLFGLSTGSSTSSDPATILANLAANAEAAASSTSTSTATTSSSSHLANDQALLQEEETQGLFGGVTASDPSSSLFNLIA